MSTPASPGSPGAGGGVTGVGTDAVHAADAAARGDSDAAARHVTSAAAGAAGAYVGGEAGARVGRALADTPLGDAASKGIKGIVVAGMVIVLVLGLMLISALSAFTAVLSTTAANAANCAPGQGASYSGSNLTQDQIAGVLYAQAQGFGLGDVGALITIGTAIGESNLTIDTDGDCWSGDCAGLGHTSSRGLFQQFGSWVPDGTAFSGQYRGQNWGHPNSGSGASRPHAFDSFNATNAWGPTGWAVKDARMDAAQGANIFILGPLYAPKGVTVSGNVISGGLEDVTAYTRIKTKPWQQVSDYELVEAAHAVQGFPVAHKGSYMQNMTRARDYMTRIKAGQIPVPAFTAPEPWMRELATTANSQTKFGAATIPVTNPNPAPTTPTGEALADGFMIIGDSIAQGVVTLGGPPREINGGVRSDYTEVGITTSAAIRKWRNQITTAPNTILVSLGSNDAYGTPDAYETQVVEFMRLAGDRDVYWYTLHWQRATALNQRLQEVAIRYPNLNLVNVNGFLDPAQLHPDASGYQQMWQTAEAAMLGGGAVMNSVLSNANCVGYSFTGGGANPLATAALAYAQEQFGKPYGLPQGNPPATWDCSKLTGGAYNFAWEQAGKPPEYAYLGAWPFLPNAALSYEQYRHPAMQFIPIDQALPGDFIFFNGNLGMSSGNPIDHVALILDPTTGMTAEAGSPVGTYDYLKRVASSANGMGVAGPPKKDGSPTLPGESGWVPVVGRLQPMPVKNTSPVNAATVTTPTTASRLEDIRTGVI